MGKRVPVDPYLLSDHGVWGICAMLYMQRCIRTSSWSIEMFTPLSGKDRSPTFQSSRDSRDAVGAQRRARVLRFAGSWCRRQRSWGARKAELNLQVWLVLRSLEAWAGLFSAEAWAESQQLSECRGHWGSLHRLTERQETEEMRLNRKEQGLAHCDLGVNKEFARWCW